MEIFKNRFIIFLIVILLIIVIRNIFQKSAVDIAIDAYNTEFERLVNEQEKQAEKKSNDSKKSDESKKDEPKKPINIPPAPPSELDKYFAEQKIESNKVMAKSMAIQLGPIIALRVARTNIAKKGGVLAVRLAVRAVEKLVGKVGVQVLSKIGIRIAQRVAVTAGAKLAAAAAKAASSGPAGAITLAFDAVSLSLDITDAGGYLQMGTNELYVAMKKELFESFKKSFAENGISLPLIYGPLDKLLENKEQYTEKINTEVELIISDINEPLLSEYNKKNAEFLAQNAETATAKQIEQVFTENFDKYVNMDKIMEKATANACAKNNGVMNSGFCTYKTSQDCKNSMIWPPTADSTFVEWDAEKKICQIASNAMYDVCKSAKLEYDWDNGLCKIDEDYCLSKGAKWQHNPKINKFDCMIPKSQEILENIFGTTVTRGTIQLFDPNQYCPCPAGTQPPSADAGPILSKFLCEKCPDSHPIRKGALCYERCPAGMEDINYGCRKIIPNEQNFIKGAGGLTYLKKSMPALKKDCGDWDRSYKDDGTSCWGAPPYPNGVGTIPEARCDPGWNRQGIGAASWCDKWECTAWWPRWLGGGCRWKDLRTSKANIFCPGGKNYVDGLCYKPCRDGFEYNGGALCAPKSGQGIKVTLMERQYCPPGYKNVAGICWSECSPGFTDIGVSCTRPGYERNPRALVTIPKTRKYAFSKKDNATVKTGNC